MALDSSFGSPLFLAIGEAPSASYTRVFQPRAADQSGLRMKNQLIPPPDLSYPSVKHLPLAKRIELWGQLVDDCEALLLAGLRRRVGPDGDLQAAYRDWCARRMEDREKAQIQFLENLSRRESGGGN
jgi:hypothetical protein